MPKQHGSVNSETKPIERKDEEEEYNLQPDNQSKMQKEEYFIKNTCYSVTKYYLCKQNNKRSLLGRKQRHQVVRSFPNRYLFSLTNKVTCLFPISCILEIIFERETYTSWAGNVYVLPPQGIRPPAIASSRPEQTPCYAALSPHRTIYYSCNLDAS